MEFSLSQHNSYWLNKKTMKKIAFGILITSFSVFAICFLFMLLGIIETEEPRRITNVCLISLETLPSLGFPMVENGYTTRS